MTPMARSNWSGSGRSPSKWSKRRDSWWPPERPGYGIVVYGFDAEPFAECIAEPFAECIADPFGERIDLPHDRSFVAGAP
jgi:hypothetical protein